MARTVIPLQTIDAFGDGIDNVSWTAADVANDHYFDNTSGQVLLLAKNGGAASRTYTIKGVADPYGRAVDTDVNVDDGEYQISGPFPPALFNQSGADINRVHVDGVTLTTCFFAAIKISR